MKFAGKFLAIGLISVAGIVIAAEATNPAAKARQTAMDTIAGNAKTLGDMAEGKADFDAAKAAEAGAAIAATAATVPDLFRANETDPKSKAKPEIWANYSDFESKAGDLMKAAQAMDTSTVEGVGAGMGALGGACGACHKAYKM
jgi:cytochrome c556